MNDFIKIYPVVGAVSDTNTVAALAVSATVFVHYHSE